MGRLLGNIDSMQLPCPDLRISVAFDADERADKLDLSCQTLWDGRGRIQQLHAVRGAERRIGQGGRRMGFALGDAAYHRAAGRLVLGPEPNWDRLVAATGCGSAGALRLGLDLVAHANDEVTLWLPDVASGAIAATARALELNCRRYRLASGTGNGLDLLAMMADLAPIAPGDLLVLPGSACNPTGLALPDEIWAALAGLCIETGAVPFILLSGPGLAREVQAECDGLQGLLWAVPEALLAVDLTPGFGLWRDPATLLFVQAQTAGEAVRTRHWLQNHAETAIGLPPEHGPRVVTEILDSPDLYPEWDLELRQIRMRLNQIRAELSAGLQDRAPDPAWPVMAAGFGPFTRLALDWGAHTRLRSEHGIYAGQDGRINLSCLCGDAVASLTSAVAASLGRAALPAADAPAQPAAAPDSAPPAAAADAAVAPAGAL